MSFPEIFVSKIFCWAPGVCSEEEWMEWKLGKKQILLEKTSPKLEFADPLFKRRLSQISRMTMQVIHDLVEKHPEAKDYKLVFISKRGEIQREFSINKGLIEESEILPAGFSLSVFNTPIAVSTISLKLTKGYSVIFPSYANEEEQRFLSDGIKSAAAPILCGDEENIILVYADEFVSEDYEGLQPEDNEPLAFACILGGKKTAVCAKSFDIGNITTVKKFISGLL